MGKQRLLGFLVLMGLISLACTCRWFTTDGSKQGLADRSDYILQITPVKNLKPSSERYRRLKEKQRNLLGFNILAKVEKVYKGKLDTNDHVALIQYGQGNCAMPFSQEGRWIVFLKEINYVVKHPEDYMEYAGDTMLVKTGSQQKLFRNVVSNYCSGSISRCVTFPQGGEMEDFLNKRLKH